MEREKEILQRISQNSLYVTGVAPIATRYCFKILDRFKAGSKVLELGPAEGVMTELLVSTGKSITVVEGANFFCESLREKFPSIEVVNSLFEEFDPGPNNQFDLIVLGHVLEHVEDPVLILKKAKQWLKSGGIIFAAVPNARSIHRQAAVAMGLLLEESQLSQLDVHHGHRIVFNPESFRAIFLKAGFKINAYGGYWLKPLSNSQIDSDWDFNMVDAFMQLGERYPDIAAEIYVVACH